MPDGLSELTARLRFHGDEDGPTIVDTMAEAADAIDRLRALLREYGRHTRACDDAINRSEFPESEPCVCGRDRSKP